MAFDEKLFCTMTSSPHSMTSSPLSMTSSPGSDKAVVSGMMTSVLQGIMGLPIQDQSVSQAVLPSPPGQPGDPEDGDSKPSPPPPMLPPCRVCGEKASGFHYGANTCEACKGFFRRSLQRKDEYKCIGDSTCEIGPGKRNACAFCRYQKCLSVGMSKTAIKTGRYTHEKKTRDIEEVKRLKLQGGPGGRGEPGTVRDAQTLREQYLEKIIHHITATHIEQTPHTPEFFERLSEKENDYIERRALQRQVFGTLKPLPQDEYMQILQSTGIDVDGRLEMISHLVPSVEKAIKRFISFAKSLPGFKELPIDDQIMLIKAAKGDSWLILAHKSFNLEQKLFTPHWGSTTSLEDMSKVNNEEYLKKLFVIAEKLKRLNLTYNETVLVAAFLIAQPDRCDGLKARLKVEEAQNTLTEALIYMFRKSHDDASIMFAKIIAIVTEMRTIYHERLNEEKNFIFQWNGKIDIPQILYEVWSS